MDNKKEPFAQCSRCLFEDRYCERVNGKSLPDCSSKLYEKELEEAKALYQEEDTLRFAAEAARQEASCYRFLEDGTRLATKPRIQEAIEFCKRMGYKRLGLAFCKGLKFEAAALAKILEEHGFTVVSVNCKVGGVDKSFLGIEDGEKSSGREHDSMCNPIAQAKILNAEHTDFNLLLGLCVGHDSLFLKHSDALSTIIVAKDRVMDHNPLAALYTSNMYYKNALHPKKQK